MRIYRFPSISIHFHPFPSIFTVCGAPGPEELYQRKEKRRAAGDVVVGAGVVVGGGVLHAVAELKTRPRIEVHKKARRFLISKNMFIS